MRPNDRLGLNEKWINSFMSSSTFHLFSILLQMRTKNSTHAKE